MWPDYDLQPQVPAGHWHRGRSPLKHWALGGGKCACSRLQVPGPAQWNWEVTNEHYTSVTLEGLLATDISKYMKQTHVIHPYPSHSTDFHETCHCGAALKEMLSLYFDPCLSPYNPLFKNFTEYSPWKAKSHAAHLEKPLILHRTRGFVVFIGTRRGHCPEFQRNYMVLPSLGIHVMNGNSGCTKFLSHWPSRKCVKADFYSRYVSRRTTHERLT